MARYGLANSSHLRSAYPESVSPCPEFLQNPLLHECATPALSGQGNKPTAQTCNPETMAVRPGAAHWTSGVRCSPVVRNFQLLDRPVALPPPSHAGNEYESHTNASRWRRKTRLRIKVRSALEGHPPRSDRIPQAA